jgi:ribonuclease G
VTLPGRYLVLLPDADYIGVSRRIGKEKERSKLKKAVGKLKSKGMGLIVRTAAEGRTAKDFKSDLGFLKRLWKSIKAKEQKGAVPRCIYRDLDLVYSTVRDLFTVDVDKFVINNREKYNKVLELVDIISPGLKNRISLYEKDYELFDFYNVEAGISKALSRKVWLKCGGYIIIDRTEALTVIDVNTGRYVGGNNLEQTVLKTNLDAAEEIALQLRLRDIGGIIIIDFIDMDKRENQKTVLEALKKALKKDRTKTTVVGMTGLGLIEMTRKKVRQELSSIMETDCSYCNGTGKVSSPQANASGFKSN